VTETHPHRLAEGRNLQWRVLDEARQVLAHRGIKADTLAPVGAPATEILAAAAEIRADVIVVAPHPGHTLHLHGSVCGRVVRYARCD
jgi:nucleotide-binding universal stress UspA family protein